MKVQQKVEFIEVVSLHRDLSLIEICSLFSHLQKNLEREMHCNLARYLELDIVGQARQSYKNLICCTGSAACNELYIIYGF